MDQIEIASWSEFQKVVEDILNKNHSSKEWKNIVFRGQSNSDWDLETTLERFSTKEFSFKQYTELLEGNIRHPLHSLSDGEISLEKKANHWDKMPPYIEYIVGLRHYSFPTPILDWTKSPYVAAYFAFSGVSDDDIKKENKVSIYTYQEYTDDDVKGGWAEKPHLQCVGSNLKTDKRHFIQQCVYTYCMREDENDNLYYCPHENAKQDTGGDIITKYVLPAALRDEFLSKLDKMNINSFTLFGTKEALMIDTANRLRCMDRL